jgi:hypothetical protein
VYGVLTIGYGNGVPKRSFEQGAHADFSLRFHLMVSFIARIIAQAFCNLTAL